MQDKYCRNADHHGLKAIGSTFMDTNLEIGLRQVAGDLLNVCLFANDVDCLRHLVELTLRRDGV